MDKHSDGHHQVLHWVAYGKLEVELYKSLTVHKRWIQPLLHHHLVCESIQTLFMKQRWNSKCWTNEKQKINTSSYRHPPFLHPNIHIRPPIFFFFFTLAILLLWRQMLPVCHTVRQTHPSGPWLPKCPSCSIQQTQISTWGHKMMRKVFTEVTERSSSGLFFFSTHSFVLTCCWLFKRNNYIQQISEASARSLWDRAGLPQKSSAVHSLCNS